MAFLRAEVGQPCSRAVRPLCLRRRNQNHLIFAFFFLCYLFGAFKRKVAAVPQYSLLVCSTDFCEIAFREFHWNLTTDSNYYIRIAALTVTLLVGLLLHAHLEWVSEKWILYVRYNLRLSCTVFGMIQQQGANGRPGIFPLRARCVLFRPLVLRGIPLGCAVCSVFLKRPAHSVPAVTSL
jgi:hypothetical protein